MLGVLLGPLLLGPLLLGPLPLGPLPLVETAAPGAESLSSPRSRSARTLGPDDAFAISSWRWMASLRYALPSRDYETISNQIDEQRETSKNNLRAARQLARIEHR